MYAAIRMSFSACLYQQEDSKAQFACFATARLGNENVLELNWPPCSQDMSHINDI